jgi:hypothetical protein
MLEVNANTDTRRRGRRSRRNRRRRKGWRRRRRRCRRRRKRSRTRRRRIFIVYRVGIINDPPCRALHPGFVRGHLALKPVEQRGGGSDERGGGGGGGDCDLVRDQFRLVAPQHAPCADVARARVIVAKVESESKTFIHQ